jgi:predicted aspartyl protease
MITGVITPSLEATIRLDVRGPSGQRREIEEVLDTGFGSLVIVQSLVIECGRM